MEESFRRVESEKGNDSSSSRFFCVVKLKKKFKTRTNKAKLPCLGCLAAKFWRRWKVGSSASTTARMANDARTGDYEMCALSTPNPTAPTEYNLTLVLI